MVVRKRGSKHAVVHCHGRDKGKTIGTHTSRKKAEAQHRAIQANKRRKKRGKGKKKK